MDAGGPVPSKKKDWAPLAGKARHGLGLRNARRSFSLDLCMSTEPENAKVGEGTRGGTSRGDPPWETVSDPPYLGTLCPAFHFS